MGTPVWDHDEFSTYVIARAKTLGIADSTAALSRATGIGHGMLSKWFRGQEQPSPRSLLKLAEALRVNQSELLVRAGHVNRQEAGLAEAPAAPPVVEMHPLAAELSQLLGDKSPLSETDRATLASLVDRVLVGWRPNRRRRSA